MVIVPTAKNLQDNRLMVKLVCQIHVMGDKNRDKMVFVPTAKNIQDNRLMAKRQLQL